MVFGFLARVGIGSAKLGISLGTSSTLIGRLPTQGNANVQNVKNVSQRNIGTISGFSGVATIATVGLGISSSLRQKKKRRR